MRKLCDGHTRPLAVNAGKHAIHYMEAWDGVRPKGVKRLRLTCPKCKRRLMSSIGTCDDGCCIIHRLPPHKPKHWWKKKKKIKKRSK